MKIIHPVEFQDQSPRGTPMRQRKNGSTRGVVVMLVAATTLLLSGCQLPAPAKPLLAGAQLMAISYLTIAEVVTMPVDGGEPVEGTVEGVVTSTVAISSSVAPPVAPTVAVTATTMVTTAAGLVGSAPLSVTEAVAPGEYSPAMPVTLSIPALDLRVPVAPMGWELVLLDGKTASRWLVPMDSAGWAVNSAGAGEPGNVVIVGHQALGEALFRPIALGDVEVGQEIDLLTTAGKRYVYKVSAESAPIPAIGATPAEEAQADAYLAQGDTPRLTRVTGWPADTSTHRVFVVADYVGEK
jgi:sortase (surface protein transpeptidase)